MPTDFTKSPGGKTAVPAQPAYSDAGADLSTLDAAPGGRIPLMNAVPGPEKDIGVGSIGNGDKPFKLDGGG